MNLSMFVCLTTVCHDHDLDAYVVFIFSCITSVDILPLSYILFDIFTSGDIEITY